MYYAADSIHLSDRHEIEETIGMGITISPNSKQPTHTTQTSARSQIKNQHNTTQQLSRYPPAPYHNLLLILPHPRIPHPHPLHNPKLRRPRLRHRRRALFTEELSIAHTPLLAKRRTLLLPDKAIKLALDTLEAAALAGRELAVEALADLLPLLAQVDAVVPDEVHFLFLVLGPWRAATVRRVAGAIRDRVVAVSVPVAVATVRIWRAGC